MLDDGLIPYTPAVTVGCFCGTCWHTRSSGEWLSWRQWMNSGSLDGGGDDGGRMGQGLAAFNDDRVRAHRDLLLMPACFSHARF